LIILDKIIPIYQHIPFAKKDKNGEKFTKVMCKAQRTGDFLCFFLPAHNFLLMQRYSYFDQCRRKELKEEVKNEEDKKRAYVHISNRRDEKRHR